ncbi:holo-ACP synthase [Microbacterium sp. EF45047]|nr:holo-ACP synthase [Microbacterium sp. EF45047]
MIIGTGIDLVDIARFERSVARTPRLLERLFTPSERTLRLRSLAARYAAKEALIKALGGSDGVHWSEIEIASEASGRPRFVLSGSTAAVVAERGITTLHLTLTHDAGLAAAFVVAERTDAPAAAQAPAAAASADTPSSRRHPVLQTSAGRDLDDGTGSRPGEGRA